MADDLIRYDVLLQDALRGVVRKVMREVADGGLPGEHHFYIAFDTTAPGVRMSSRLRQQHPEEMTIVLQHQFWDLSVSDHGFEVGLSFGGVPERLLIPFAAVKGFFDPSVQFGLQFDPAGATQQGNTAATSGTSGPAAAGGDGSAGKGEPVGRQRPLPALPRRVEPQSAEGEAGAEEAGADADEDADKARPKESADVVSLDAFRKKP